MGFIKTGSIIHTEEYSDCLVLLIVSDGKDYYIQFYIPKLNEIRRIFVDSEGNDITPTFSLRIRSFLKRIFVKKNIVE